MGLHVALAEPDDDFATQIWRTRAAEPKGEHALSLLFPFCKALSCYEFVYSCRLAEQADRECQPLILSFAIGIRDRTFCLVSAERVYDGSQIINE